jgi:CubicO group peptidase (beta-lactamase class C family)
VWDYSLAVDALGLIVEAVSGKPLATFLQERIWAPLGMVDTGFSVPDAKKNRHAQAFATDPRTGKAQFVLQADGKPLKFDCGGGCAMSTAPDYLRFAQMLANGGILDGKRIIAPRTLAMMTTDQLGADVRARTTSPVLPKGYGFGLGFAVRTQPGIAAFARQRRRLLLGRRLRHLFLGRSEGAADGGADGGGARRDPDRECAPAA